MSSSSSKEGVLPKTVEPTPEKPSNNPTIINDNSPFNQTTTEVNIPSIENIACGKKRKRIKTRWGTPPRKKRWGNKKEIKVEIIANNIQTTSNASNLSFGHLLQSVNSPLFRNFEDTASDFFAKNHWTVKQTKIFLLRMKFQEAQTKLFNPTVYWSAHKNDPKSPSPEPIYDTKGIRVNTREVRFKENAEKSRTRIIQELLEIDQSFVPPSDYKPPKLTKRIDLPVDDYPDYNFFGLIVGPRGNTQKAMQKETGCKIAVRGRGTAFDKPLNMVTPEDEEPLHVFITAPDKESMRKASSIIERLIYEVKNGGGNHKTQQLLELATINGTLKFETRCRICGGLGHPIWRCPERTGEQWTPAQVQCQICGEISHITIDCKHFDKSKALKDQIVLASHKTAAIDNEYSQFMAELTGDAPVISYKPAIAAIAAPPSTMNAVITHLPVLQPLLASLVPTLIEQKLDETAVGTGVNTYHNVPPPLQIGSKPMVESTDVIQNTVSSLPKTSLMPTLVPCPSNIPMNHNLPLIPTVIPSAVPYPHMGQNPYLNFGGNGVMSQMMFAQYPGYGQPWMGMIPQPMYPPNMQRIVQPSMPNMYPLPPGYGYPNPPNI